MNMLGWLILYANHLLSTGLLLSLTLEAWLHHTYHNLPTYYSWSSSSSSSSSIIISYRMQRGWSLTHSSSSKRCELEEVWDDIPTRQCLNESILSLGSTRNHQLSGTLRTVQYLLLWLQYSMNAQRLLLLISMTASSWSPHTLPIKTRPDESSTLLKALLWQLDRCDTI